MSHMLYSPTKMSANHPSIACGLIYWQFVALEFEVAGWPLIAANSTPAAVQLSIRVAVLL